MLEAEEGRRQGQPSAQGPRECSMEMGLGEEVWVALDTGLRCHGPAGERCQVNSGTCWSGLQDRSWQQLRGVVFFVGVVRDVSLDEVPGGKWGE